MNELKFLEVMGKIDDELIKEAEIDIEQMHRRRHIRSNRRFFAVSSVAAAAVIAVGAFAFGKTYKPAKNTGNDDSIIISDNIIETTLSSQFAETCITTKAEQTAVTARSKVSSVSSSATEAKATTTTNNNKPKTTSLSDTSKTAQNSHTQQTAAAVVSSGTETGTVSTEISTVPDNDYENEGSNIMKKFAAAIAALTAISSSSTSIAAEASNYALEISPTASSVKKFIDEYNVDVDINSDGTIDIFDVYAMYRCQLGPQESVPDYIMEKYNSMTKSKENDQEEKVIIKGNVFYQNPFYFSPEDFAEYFFTYYGLELEYFDPNYYIDNCPDKYNDTVPLDVLKETVKDIKSWNIENYYKTAWYAKNEEGTFRPYTADEIENSYYYDDSDESYKLKEDHCDYDSEISNIHAFISDFKSYSTPASVQSNILMEKLTTSELIDMDINSDGVYDFDDIVLVAHFLNTYTDDEKKENNLFYYSLTDKLKGNYYENYPAELRESPDVPMTENEWNKARDFMDAARYYFDYDADHYIIIYLTENYLLENEVDQKYFDPVYYEKNHFAHFEYDENWIYVDSDSYSGSAFFEALDHFEFLSHKYGPGAEKYRESVELSEYIQCNNDAKKAALFPIYYKDAKTGAATEPDLNLDGKIDIADYIILDGIEWSLGCTYEIECAEPIFKHHPELLAELNISQEARDNYKNNFDFNNNGISCDCIEIYCMRMYILNELEAQYSSEEALYNAIGDYEKEHPELKYHRFSLEKMEEFCKDNNVGFTRRIEEETEYTTDTEEIKVEYTEGLKGDSNCDDKIDVSDSVLIMQALSNPSKYGVNGSDENHITEEGYELADVDGEGVTNMDALTIQKYLLGLSNIE